MPYWFTQATAHSSSLPEILEAAPDPAPQSPKDRRSPRQPPPFPSPPMPASPQPIPKLQQPPTARRAGKGLGAAESKDVASVSTKPRRLPFSSIQPNEVSIDAICLHASGGAMAATRTVHFQLPPAAPETLSLSRARGIESVVRGAAEQERRAPSSPTPALTSSGWPASASLPAPYVYASYAQPGRNSTANANAPRVGPFRLLRSLTGGTFGATYMAHDVGTSRIVCARVFKKDRLACEEKIKRGVLVEAQCYKVIAASAAPDRVCLMELHGVLQDEERIMFIMPLMQYDLLDALGAASGRLDRILIRRWVAQMALGIDALHRMGIIHRDIKPENVLLDAPNGNARLADLNAAFIVQAGTPLADGEVYTKRPVGSQPYMAWEVAEGRWYGKMADWWGLGCVMFDLLTNAILFKDHGARKKYASWDCELDGMSFLQYMGDLTGEEERVISGLIDLRTSSRFQLRHLRHHIYFFEQNRVNVFDALLREPPEDLVRVGRPTHPSLLEVLDDLKDAPLYHASVQPPKLRWCERGPGEEDDLSDVGWVNKRGIWRV